MYLDRVMCVLRAVHFRYNIFLYGAFGTAGGLYSIIVINSSFVNAFLYDMTIENDLVCLYLY